MSIQPPRLETPRLILRPWMLKDAPSVYQLASAREVADTTLEQDLGRKLRDYATAGIPVYWVVDVNAQVVHVMTQPSGGDYKRNVLRFGEPLNVPGTNTTVVID